MILKSVNFGIGVSVLMLVLPSGVKAQLLSSSVDSSKEIVFKYAPPVPLSFSETVTTSRTTIAAGMDPAEEVSISKVKADVRKEGEGFVISTEPVSFEIKRGDDKVKDPVMDYVQSLKLIYHIDAGGKMKSVDGYQGVLQAASKLAPKELQGVLKTVMTEEALATREKAQWNLRIGDLAGQKATKNTVWLGDGIFPFPDGSVGHYYVITVFSGLVDKDGKKVAKLDLLYETNPEKIQQRVNDLARDLVQHVPKPQPLEKSAAFKIEGSGTRLIDPSTMLVYAEKANRSVSWSMKVGKDNQIPVLIQETKEYQLEYGLK